jgi:hypothetical protein
MATIATQSTHAGPNSGRWAPRTLVTGRTPATGHFGPVSVLAALAALFRVVFSGPAATGQARPEAEASVPSSVERGR